MKKRMILALIISSVLLFCICWNYVENKPKYTLSLPELEKIEKITIEEKTIENKEEIQEIINILNKEEKTTTIESISDTPTNTSEKLKIEFHFIEKGSSILFVYKRNNHFYIEQSYNGIYKITENEYNKIKSYGTM